VFFSGPTRRPRRLSASCRLSLVRCFQLYRTIELSLLDFLNPSRLSPLASRLPSNAAGRPPRTSSRNVDEAKGDPIRKANASSNSGTKHFAGHRGHLSEVFWCIIADLASLGYPITIPSRDTTKVTPIGVSVLRSLIDPPANTETERCWPIGDVLFQIVERLPRKVEVLTCQR